MSEKQIDSEMMKRWLTFPRIQLIEGGIPMADAIIAAIDERDRLVARLELAEKVVEAAQFSITERDGFCEGYWKRRNEGDEAVFRADMVAFEMVKNSLTAYRKSLTPT